MLSRLRLTKIVKSPSGWTPSAFHCLRNLTSECDARNFWARGKKGQADPLATAHKWESEGKYCGRCHEPQRRRRQPLATAPAGRAPSSAALYHHNSIQLPLPVLLQALAAVAQPAAAPLAVNRAVQQRAHRPPPAARRRWLLATWRLQNKRKFSFTTEKHQ